MIKFETELPLYKLIVQSQGQEYRENETTRESSYLLTPLSYKTDRATGPDSRPCKVRDRESGRKRDKVSLKLALLLWSRMIS